MNTSLFRTEVLEPKYQSLDGEVILTQPVQHKMILVFLGLFILVLAIYVSLGQYSVKINAAGYLRPNNGLIKVKSSQNLTVSKVLINNGEMVEKGQPLLVVSSEIYGSEQSFNQENFKLLEAQITAINEQIEALQEEHSFLMNSNEKEIAVRLSEKNKIFKKLPLLESRIKNSLLVASDMAKLENGGLISTLDVRRQDPYVTARKTGFRARATED